MNIYEEFNVRITHAKITQMQSKKRRAREKDKRKEQNGKLQKFKKKNTLGLTESKGIQIYAN